MTDTSKTAHQTPDQTQVYHCYSCFSGETAYLTRDGVKTFADTVGTTQWVLTADDHDRVGGRWVQAQIGHFGEQPLMAVTLRRNGVTKVVYATPEHRWLVKGGPRRSINRDVITRDLAPGMRLSSLKTPGVSPELQMDHAGVRHGVVFGDGTANRKSANLTLWGEKDKQLADFFPEQRFTHVVTPSGVPGLRTSNGLRAWMKSLPSANVDDGYLYGWLAGYFAADGHVTGRGQAQLHSAQLETLEAVRDLALRLGIHTYGITSQTRTGYGDIPTPLFRLTFVTSTLAEDFFLIEQHRDRYRFRNHSYERLGWVVVSVEETDRVDSVYCATVPGTHTFALEDNVWVGNCGSGNVVARSDGSVECGFCSMVFTVRVQPRNINSPQTINGQPVDIPGMPGNAQQDPVVQQQDAPADPAGGELPPEGPGASQKVVPGFSDEEMDETPQPGVDDPMETFTTASGQRLSRRHYVQHLMLAAATAEQRPKVLARIKRENARRR